MSIWNFIAEKLAAKIPVMLLWVLESEGSSPGRQGFAMAVSKNGDFYGTIGGGIMEHKLVEKAKVALHKGIKLISLTRQYHDKQHATDRSGMICSGSQLNAFFPLDFNDLPLIQNIITAENNSNKIVKLQPTGISLATSNKEENSTVFFEYISDEEWLYITPIKNEPVVHIFGGGHVGLALSQQLSFLNFYIKIYDNRPALHTMMANHWAHEKHLINYDALEEEIKIKEEDYAVIVTVGYKTDKTIFQQLLHHKLRYLGMMGSEAKIKTLLTEMEMEGLSPSLWKDCFLPIGVPIHSRTAEEIAVSIAAEIIFNKNKNLPTGRSNFQSN